MEVAIPPGATATVYVPATDSTAVREGGRPAKRSPGVTFLRGEGGRAVYDVGSGHYVFTATAGQFK